MRKLEIVLKKSPIGHREKDVRILRALGFKKVGDKVVKGDTPTIRGMIKKVIQMVRVKEIEE